MLLPLVVVNSEAPDGLASSDDPHKRHSRFGVTPRVLVYALIFGENVRSRDSRDSKAHSAARVVPHVNVQEARIVHGVEASAPSNRHCACESYRSGQLSEHVATRFGRRLCPFRQPTQLAITRCGPSDVSVDLCDSGQLNGVNLGRFSDVR